MLKCVLDRLHVMSDTLQNYVIEVIAWRVSEHHRNKSGSVRLIGLCTSQTEVLKCVLDRSMYIADFSVEMCA